MTGRAESGRRPFPRIVGVGTLVLAIVVWQTVSLQEELQRIDAMQRRLGEALAGAAEAVAIRECRGGRAVLDELAAAMAETREVLEVAWIAREQADASRLTDAKLAVYNRVLKEQVAELEEALPAVITHPRYHPLARYHDPFFGELRFDGPQERNRLRLPLNALRRSGTALRGPRGREEVRAILEDYVPRERRLPAWL